MNPWREGNPSSVELLGELKDCHEADVRGDGVGDGEDRAMDELSPQDSGCSEGKQVWVFRRCQRCRFPTAVQEADSRRWDVNFRR
jgi:hypothetical protein